MKFALALVFVVGTATSAQAQSRVAVVRSGEHSDIERRIHAELGALGLLAVGVEIPGGHLDFAQLEEVAARVSASAVIAIHVTARGLEASIFDRVTSKGVTRVMAERPPFDARLVALRAVELLRASLVEVVLVPPQTSEVLRRSELPADMEALLPNMNQGDHEALRLRLGVALSLNPGSIEPGTHIALDLTYQFALGLGPSLWALMPITTPSIEASEGQADLSLTAAGAALAWQPMGPGHVLDLRFGVGLGFVWIRVLGSASAPYLGGADSAVSALLRADFAATLWLNSILGVHLEASLMGAFPRPTIVFAGRMVADWGRPATLLTVGVTLAPF